VNKIPNLGKDVDQVTAPKKSKDKKKGGSEGTIRQPIRETGTKGGRVMSKKGKGTIVMRETETGAKDRGGGAKEGPDIPKTLYNSSRISQRGKYSC